MTRHLYKYTTIRESWTFCSHSERIMMEGAGYWHLDLTIKRKDKTMSTSRGSTERWLREPMDFKLPGEFFE